MMQNVRQSVEWARTSANRPMVADLVAEWFFPVQWRRDKGAAERYCDECADGNLLRTECLPVFAPAALHQFIQRRQLGLQFRTGNCSWKNRLGRLHDRYGQLASTVQSMTE